VFVACVHQAGFTEGDNMHRAVLIAVIAVPALFLIGCVTVPGHNDAWLSYKISQNCGAYNDDHGCKGPLGDTTAAFRYYVGLGIADPDHYTLDMWLAQNGFTPGVHPDAHAFYANLRDLQIGRDMNCLQSGQRIACYVTNYGPIPAWFNVGILDHGWLTNDGNGAGGIWPNVTHALDDAINARNPLGTVAMTYDPSQSGPNQVAFFAFDAGGPLLYKVILDGEGPKAVPRMCMACHGGTYDTNADTATGSSFLPFDTFAFRYSDAAGYTFEDQQEPLRQLNALVASTNPNQPIIDLINGLYPSGVANTGSEAVDGFVPQGWADNPTLYTGVVRQYCRMCHVSESLAFTASSDFTDHADLIQSLVCGKHDMPHAQVPYGIAYEFDINGPGASVGFWHDAVAQRDLGQFFQNQGIKSCLPSD
jgi:hypothetical protein